MKEGTRHGDEADALELCSLHMQHNNRIKYQYPKYGGSRRNLIIIA